MPQAVVRTCIEGRSHHLLSLTAPGERCLHVVFRTGLTRAGTTRWVHRRETPQGGEGWVTEVFSPGKPEAWTHTQALAQSLGTEGRLRAVHAVLGTRGRILTLSRGQAPGRASVGWQLDRCASPVEALTACGFGGAWPEAASILKELFGLVPQPRSGPWTIELPLLEADTGLRLGTTAWARCAEDTGKRRRLVALVERLGGDSRYAEALYKLVISARAEGDLPAVGRAVELELAGDGVRSVALFLALPNTGEVSHHQGSERKSNRELERRGP